MSSPRYTRGAWAEITVTGATAASATATAVFPTPVGPTTTGVRCRASGAAKSPFQFVLWQLHEARPPVDVMGGKRRGQQPHDQLAHLANVDRLSRLGGRAAGGRGGRG